MGNKGKSVCSLARGMPSIARSNGFRQRNSNPQVTVVYRHFQLSQLDRSKVALVSDGRSQRLCHTSCTSRCRLSVSYDGQYQFSRWQKSNITKEMGLWACLWKMLLVTLTDVGRFILILWGAWTVKGETGNWVACVPSFLSSSNYGYDVTSCFIFCCLSFPQLNGPDGPMDCTWNCEPK